MTDRRIAIAIFVLALVPYAYFYGGWGANQEVNYALTRAMVEARTFAIDKLTVYEGDIASGEGNPIYSNKPPGLSVLGAIPYSIQYRAQQRGMIRFDDYWRTNKQLVTIAVCGVSGALIATILYLYGRGTLRVSQRSAAVVAIAIAFATIVFPDSTMLFAHVPAALFLLLAFTLLKTRPFLAGAAAGIAGACSFLSIPAACLLAALALAYSKKHAAWFIAGGVPFAVALAIYQWICFGSPFVTPVQRSIFFTEKGLMLGVFGTPNLAHLRAIAFSEYRGLFLCSPVLLFAFAGAIVMLRRKQFRAELLAIAAITIFYFVTVSSFNGWHGGAAFGPRYLWLVVMSIVTTLNLAAAAVEPMPVDGMLQPIRGHILPTLLTDKISLVPDSGDVGEPYLGKGRAISILTGNALLLRRTRETA